MAMTIPVYFFIATLLSYLLSSQLSFSLISYEQSDFPNRLLVIMVILFIPALMILAEEILRKVLKQNIITKTIWLILLLFLLLSSFYLSYPRFDHYYNSHLYAVSESDQKAVEWIESQTTEPYIVLANQQTGAMALRLYGFNRYYRQMYFYPLPTSGPLYQYFLSLVYKKADKETVVKAMDLAGVSEAYFILPEYWWGAPRIISQAIQSADSYIKIDGGKEWVFKYVK
jgi:hypothetical protein